MNFLTNIDLHQNQLLNALLQPLSIDPANAKQGQVYVKIKDSGETKDAALMLYTGSQWVEVGRVYILPQATESTLGGIKIGTGLSMDEATGKVSVSNEGMAVGSANKLTTARNITVQDGESGENFAGSAAFDGSADITIKLALTEAFNSKLAQIATNQTDISNLTTKVNGLATIKLQVLVNPDSKTIEELVAGEARKENIIYLFPNADNQTNNFYDEYIYIAAQDKFELIGTTKVNLTGYLTEASQITFTEAETLANVASQDTIPVVFGKLAKLFTTLSNIEYYTFETTSTQSSYPETTYTLELGQNETLVKMETNFIDADNKKTSAIIDCEIPNSKKYIYTFNLKEGESIGFTCTKKITKKLLD